jgi:hypothetical protein
MVIDQELMQLLQRIFIELIIINRKKHMILLYFMPIFYVISFASKNKNSNSNENYDFLFIRIMQFPIQAWLRITLNHGSITHIAILSDGSIVMKSVGDSGFIPSNKVTF